MTSPLLRWLNRHLSKNREEGEGVPPIAFTSELPMYARHSIGRRTYGCPTIHIWQPDAKLLIGNYCSIATGVQIMLGGEHLTTWVTTYPFAEIMPAAASSKPIGYSKGDVRIGNDVWIGHNSLILSGVTVGDGAVIGAGSVVTKDVEPYAIVAGNPARLIRHRIAQNLIPAMLRIQWWNWSEDLIVSKLALLQSPNVEEFVRASMET